jgi:lysophospholipase L1-like esterase
LTLAVAAANVTDMISNVRLSFLSLLLVASLQGQVPQTPSDVKGPFEPGSEAAPFTEFRLVRAPSADSLLLKKGDRLAIIGDSITEQKMYSRIMETYLTVCVPQLEITARQFGWSGETAEGFARRMASDCLRFNPTIATLCYGMNDHRYRTYDPENGQWYRNQYTAVVRGLLDAGARVVIGSPGSVGKVPGWTKSDSFSLQDLNLNLATLRNIDIDIAATEGVRFADVFWPMLKADHEARQRFGADYAVPGKDGVHPGWAGQLVMAYCFLEALGLDGDIGLLTVDLATSKASGSDGHTVTGFTDGVVSVRSVRYPFCAEGDPDSDNSIRSGMTLVPFNEELNRLTLKATGGKAANYRVTWGQTAKIYSADKLAEGINLAAEFVINPFTDAFKKVDEAVAAKQNYETRQIKTMFHGPEIQAAPDAVVALTEKVRQPLAAAIATSFIPVDHQIRIEAR